MGHEEDEDPKLSVAVSRLESKSYSWEVLTRRKHEFEHLSSHTAEQPSPVCIVESKGFREANFFYPGAVTHVWQAHGFRTEGGDIQTVPVLYMAHTGDDNLLLFTSPGSWGKITDYEGGTTVYTWHPHRDTMCSADVLECPGAEASRQKRLAEYRAAHRFIDERQNSTTLARCKKSNKHVHVDQAIVEWNERILL
ncbi:uncharacterized protein EDB91DRAFT_1076791 [Suillus paluster]|uniref:uncharacterized protein n=1 Tax=Suillus paluster TaxID=48578 RepID=UPI001B86B1AE|nr:uncharacterized protein EDB91DRAFT_1076791 [Suillus paluster]KAG1756879.1 hypothetical protein EDB91DRAFT_1076791 [Suillus paluster]